MTFLQVISEHAANSQDGQPNENHKKKVNDVC